MYRYVSALCVLLCLLAGAVEAQVLSSGPAASATSSTQAQVLVRGADDRVTVRATRITQPIVLDGELKEEIYATVPSIDGFLQQEPAEGEPGTERTQAWLFFDDRNIYVSARLHDSEPEREVISEMRRDGQGTNDNESFGVAFDTFHDRRNGYLFQISLAGGLFDGSITDERDMNRDWNTVWDARTARTPDGWTVEMAIPFKSLRFPPDSTDWGINLKRVVKWKNETQYLTRIPAALGRRGINKLSSAATLVGIETPQARRNFEVKPYGSTGFATSSPAGGIEATDGKAQGGFDVKLGITDGLTSDFTYNTDFAQVEEDEQQVNLTRFSVLFPEKRDFFLEGQGIFSFGGVSSRPPGGGGGGFGNPVQADVPMMFFSRRIGLVDGGQVPIDAGGRVTGKAGPYSIGLIDIRTSDVPGIGIPATNFGVVRVKRDILRRSAVGVLFTDRSASTVGPGHAQTAGVDGVFSFYQNLNFNTYVAATDNPGTSGSNVSYRGQLDYNADKYGLQLERLTADQNFLPDVGFMRRLAFSRNSVYGRYSPRPHSKIVRKFFYEGVYDYITDPGNRPQSKLAQGAFHAELQNSDAFGVEVAQNFESLDQPFQVYPGVIIPTGEYTFNELHVMYNFGPQRPVSAGIQFEVGQFYDGNRTAISTNRGRIQINPQLTVEPGLTLNMVTLPEGDFTSTLFTTRVTYTVTPRMSASALMQYNSGTASFSNNIRFRWEYRPGSDLFVVLTDNRDTLPTGFPELRNRSFVVKMTRLFRF